MDCSFFSADEEVLRLLDHDPEVALEITKKFGLTAYDSSQKADRAYLRSLITRDLESKEALEAILHPRLRSQWHPQAMKAFRHSHPIFVAEIPLLYEKDLARYFDQVIVVAASPNVQLQRLMQHRQLSSEIAHALLNIQQPLEEKVCRADIVVWNDGNERTFFQQLEITLLSILQLQNS